jgi:hypothetical protein
MFMSDEATERFLLFYRGEGEDHCGRKLRQIIAKSDVWLEETHDYIQWLFPLPTASRFNPDAPILKRDLSDARLLRLLLQSPDAKSGFSDRGLAG